MGEKCCACGKLFMSNDTVITFYFEQVKHGDKSGLLGFYEHANSPEGSVEHVHFTYGCLEKCFSPMDNPFMYDHIAEAVRREIYEDEIDEIDLPPFHEDEDPPTCLWCKKDDAVWKHTQRDMHIYNCLRCQKLWDHNEDELYWDQSKSEYVIVGY